MTMTITATKVTILKSSSLTILTFLFVLLSSGVLSTVGFVHHSHSSRHNNIKLSSQSTSTMEAVAPTTLGPTMLRTLVQNAAMGSQQKNTVDLSGIVWMEHLNLVVGDMDLAMKFYVDFIGLSRDSNPKHVNLGQQQFHLAATDDPAQRITGSIGLTVPSLEKVKQRIERAKLDLQGTLFAIIEEGDKMMSVSDPWGNIFHLYDISLDDDHTIESTGQSSQKMVNMHAVGGAYGAHRMAVRGQPGIRYVEFAVPLSTAQPIAQFYTDVMKCNQVETVEENGYECAIIGVGPGVHFVFVESSELTAESLEYQNGVHACIYISNFQSVYHDLDDRGLIWTNPRFTHLDSCDTWEEAFASKTLRFKDLIDIRTGQKVLELEHETRPMFHGQYLKVPHYNPN